MTHYVIERMGARPLDRIGRGAIACRRARILSSLFQQRPCPCCAVVSAFVLRRMGVNVDAFCPRPYLDVIRLGPSPAARSSDRRSWRICRHGLHHLKLSLLTLRRRS